MIRWSFGLPTGRATSLGPGAHEHAVLRAGRDEKMLSAEPKDRPKEEDRMPSN